MRNRLFVTLGLLVIGGVLIPHTADSADGDYVVIVHGQSSVSAITTSELGDLYLRKTARWKNGIEIEPVDLAASSPVRVRFCQNVLGRSVPAVQAYWRKLIFSGQGLPPIELSQDNAVLEYVGKHPGAIGYVSAGADTKSANVKKVKVNG